jgi:hypothetical protein
MKFSRRTVSRFARHDQSIVDAKLIFELGEIDGWQALRC